MILEEHDFKVLSNPGNVASQKYSAIIMVVQPPRLLTCMHDLSRLGDTVMHLPSVAIDRLW